MSLAKYLAKMKAAGNGMKLLGEEPAAEKIVGLSPLGWGTAAGAAGAGALGAYSLMGDDEDEKHHKGDR